MISFTIITDTPATFTDKLIAGGVMQETDINGKTTLVGVRSGIEWVEVPNILITSLAVGERFLPDGTNNPSYVPQVMDQRHVYLVKAAWDAENNEKEGLAQEAIALDGKITRLSPLESTKFGQWITTNAKDATLTSADGRSWPAHVITDNLWVVESGDFGVWQ